MSDATLFQIKPIVGVSQKRPTISLLNKSGSGTLRPGAAGVIAPKLLWPRRGCRFWCFLFSGFRLSLCLAGWSRRATGLPRLRRLLTLL